MPSCLLIAVHDLDQSRLAPCAAKDLKPNWQALAHESHGNGDGGKAGRGRQAGAVVAMRRVEIANHARRKGPSRPEHAADACDRPSPSERTRASAACSGRLARTAGSGLEAAPLDGQSAASRWMDGTSRT